MLGLLRLLHLRHARRHPMRSVLTVLSLAAGVALAVSVIVVRGSVMSSVDDFARRVAGPAPLRVVGPASRGGLDESVLGTVRTVPGVGTAIPLVQAVTYADGRGHRELVAALGTTDAREVQLSPTLARLLGPARSLRTDVGDVSLRDAAVAPVLDRVNGGRVVAVPLATAQQWFARPAALDAVYVVPAPGVAADALRARLARAVGEHNSVLTATDPPTGITAVLGFFLALFGVFSLFALAIGAMLARNTLVLTLAERRRDLAVAAAVGATPRSVAAAVLAEVAILGAVGGLLGAAGGVALAGPILGSASGFVSRLFGMQLSVHAGISVVVISVAVGVGAAVLASWRPARRAARLDIAAELGGREAAAEAAPLLNARRGAVLVVIAFGGLVLTHVGSAGGGIEAWQPAATEAGMLVAALGFIGAVGAFAPLVAGLLLRSATNAPGSVQLGITTAARAARRTGLMTIAIAAAVGIAFCIASSTKAVRASVLESILAEGNRVSVNTMPPNNTVNLDAKPAPSTVAALAHVPGVAAVEQNAALMVRQPDGSMIGVVASDRADLHLDGALLHGRADQAAFDRGEVIVGPALVRKVGARPGHRLRLATRHGVVELRVQGVEQTGNFNGAVVLVPYDLMTRLYGPQPPSYVTLKLAPGADAAQVAAAVERAHLQPHLTAKTRVEIAGEIADDITSQFAAFWALQRGLVLVAFLAVLFTLLLSAVQRRREIGVLAAIGMQPREIAGMVLTEAATVGVVGSVLGSVAAIAIVVGMNDVVAVVVGYRDPLRLDVPSALVWSILAVLFAVAAAAWPATRTARTEVLPALQYE